MDTSPESWTRDLWLSGGGDALVFYVVFGQQPQSFDISAKKYRTNGLPPSIEVRYFSRSRNADYIDGFSKGHAWEELCANDPSLAAAIEAAPDCLIVSGTVEDPDSLSYLRDAIGHVTYILDESGRAVLDLQTWSWYSPSRWHGEIFDSDTFDPHRHVVILVSPQEDGSGSSWVHTRGMRKFGRPDISVHDVAVGDGDSVGWVCNALISHHAAGGVVVEGQRVRMTELGWIGIAHHGGDLEDDDFNNVHIEITRLR